MIPRKDKPEKPEKGREEEMEIPPGPPRTVHTPSRPVSAPSPAEKGLRAAIAEDDMRTALGIVLERLGNLEKALDYMRKELTRFNIVIGPPRG